jgi:hypothetical protein
MKFFEIIDEYQHLFEVLLAFMMYIIGIIFTCLLYKSDDKIRFDFWQFMKYDGLSHPLFERFMLGLMLSYNSLRNDDVQDIVKRGFFRYKFVLDFQVFIARIIPLRNL